MPKQNPTLEIIRALGFSKITFHEGEWKHTVLHRQMQTADMHDGSRIYLIPRRATRRVAAHFVDCYHAATGVQLARSHAESQYYAMVKARARVRQWQDSPETYQEDVNQGIANYANRYRLYGAAAANIPPRFIQYLEKQDDNTAQP